MRFLVRRSMRAGPATSSDAVTPADYLKLASLIRSYRNNGHIVARLDPLWGEPLGASRILAPELTAFRNVSGCARGTAVRAVWLGV